MPSRVCFDDQAFYRHRHPIWPSAPMLQVCVLLYKIEGVTHAKAFVDQSPFEFAPSSTRPILEYAMIDGILVRQRAGTGFNQRREEIEGQGTASFHTASVQTWTRHQPHGPRLRCTCSPHYTTEMQNHTDPMMCAARTIGHRIADRIWANQPIAGLRVRLSHSSV